MSKSLLLLVLPVFAVGIFVVALFSHYQGSYAPPAPVNIQFEQLTSPSAPTGDFMEMALPEIHRGTMVIDAAHRNRYFPEELVSLTTQVANRGYQVSFLGDFRGLDTPVRENLLEERLRDADSLVVIQPQESYSLGEVALIKQFVRKGGKLLLIADPSRSHDINSLAESFGINFQPDYLYNLHEYDLNFRDVFIREFQPDELTQGLGEIALYTAGSIRTSGAGLAFTDANTRSSLAETETRFYPMARGDNPNVIALYDLTFLVPPHSSILDNSRLVSNLADYLVDSQRRFELVDFPRFFKGEVDLVLGRSATVDQGTVFKEILSDHRIESSFVSAEDLSRDTVFLGTYADTAQVAPYLDALDINLGGELATPFTPTTDAEETAVLLLYRSLDRDVLVVLSNSPEGLTDLIAKMDTGRFRTGLVDDFVGVYKTQ